MNPCSWDRLSGIYYLNNPITQLGASDRLSDTTVKAVLDTFILMNRFQQLASTHKEQTA